VAEIKTFHLEDVEKTARSQRGRRLMEEANIIGGMVICGVYVVRGEGVCKIGKSRNVGARLRAHALTLMDEIPGVLHLRGILECHPKVVDAVEVLIHWCYRDRWIKNELFRLPLDPDPLDFRSVGEVLELVASSLGHYTLNKRRGFQCVPRPARFRRVYL